MTDNGSKSEPSMDEILASIRQIIQEDPQAPEKVDRVTVADPLAATVSHGNAPAQSPGEAQSGPGGSEAQATVGSQESAQKAGPLSSRLAKAIDRLNAKPSSTESPTSTAAVPASATPAQVADDDLDDLLDDPLPRFTRAKPGEKTEAPSAESTPTPQFDDRSSAAGHTDSAASPAASPARPTNPLSGSLGGLIPSTARSLASTVPVAPAGNASQPSEEAADDGSTSAPDETTSHVLDAAKAPEPGSALAALIASSQAADMAADTAADTTADAETPSDPVSDSPSQPGPAFLPDFDPPSSLRTVRTGTDDGATETASGQEVASPAALDFNTIVPAAEREFGGSIPKPAASTLFAATPAETPSDPGSPEGATTGFDFGAVKPQPFRVDDVLSPDRSGETVEAITKTTAAEAKSTEAAGVQATASEADDKSATAAEDDPADGASESAAASSFAGLNGLPSFSGKPAGDAKVAEDATGGEVAEEEPAAAQTDAPALPGAMEKALERAAGIAPEKSQEDGKAAASGAAAVETSLDDTAAELLRPLVREWLDKNMPRIVERALQVELAKGVAPMDAAAKDAAAKDAAAKTAPEVGLSDHASDTLDSPTTAKH